MQLESVSKEHQEDTAQLQRQIGDKEQEVDTVSRSDAVSQPTTEFLTAPIAIERLKSSRQRSSAGNRLAAAPAAFGKERPRGTARDRQKPGGQRTAQASRSRQTYRASHWCAGRGIER